MDVSASTLLMMRSIAEIAREHGIDVSSTDGKKTCLEAFVLGGPRSDDDDLDAAYWTTRLSLIRAGIDTLIRRAAMALDVTLTDRMVGQTVPVIGALFGAGINYSFMRYYQNIAAVHFTLRKLESVHGGEAVRACFDGLR